eukprot:gene8689-biopygen6973
MCDRIRRRFADKTYTRNGRRMTAAQVRAVHEARRTVLRQRGYRVITMKECIWRERCRRHDDPARAFVRERRREQENDPLERCADWVGYTTQETLIEALLQRKVFGLITCDVHVPEERREYFREFAPIIKHAYVNYADVGEFMQTVADENDITIKDRKCVIDSYVGRRIMIHDEYFVWLLEHDVECTRVYDFIRYDKQPIFAEFGRDITRLRVQGDQDKSSEMKANTAKLVGNSAFGSCITNKDKHRDVRLVSLLEQQDGRMAKTRMLTRDQLLTNRQTRREIASMNTFVRYEQVCPQVLEVESKKRRILYDQPRYIGKTIFDRAKLSVLRFVYDFLKRVLKPDHFELLETDTDSIYLGMKEDRFEDNVAEDKREEYERLKHDYFVTEKCEFGKRQPNRYKLEFSGHRMVSLCSKSYCGFNETTRDVKISSKGVQKRNFVQQSIERRRRQRQEGTDNQDISDIIYDIYREGLKTDPHDNCKTHTSTNRGIKRKNNLMQTKSGRKAKRTDAYEQDTKLLKFIFPTSYQEETFCFLYDFFMQVPNDLSASEEEEIQIKLLNQFPLLRLEHESIATAQLILSECTMDLTTIVLEVKLSVLFEKYYVYSSDASGGGGGGGDHATIGNIKMIIPDEYLLLNLSNLWKRYVFIRKFDDNSSAQQIMQKAKASLNEVACIIEFIDTQLHKKLSTSLFTDLHAFKIEEILKDYVSWLCKHDWENIPKTEDGVLRYVDEHIRREFMCVLAKKHIPEYAKNIGTSRDCVPRQPLLYKKTHPMWSGGGRRALSNKTVRDHALLPDDDAPLDSQRAGDDDGFVFHQIDPELIYKTKLEAFRHNLSLEMLKVITRFITDSSSTSSNNDAEEKDKAESSRAISKRTKAKLELWSDINKTVNKNLQREHNNDNDEGDDHSEMTTITDDDDDDDKQEQYLHNYADNIDRYYESIADETLQNRSNTCRQARPRNN